MTGRHAKPLLIEIIRGVEETLNREMHPMRDRLNKIESAMSRLESQAGGAAASPGSQNRRLESMEDRLDRIESAMSRLKPQNGVAKGALEDMLERASSRARSPSPKLAGDRALAHSR